MTVFDIVRSLTSFRDCSEETLPRKVIGKILEAGRQAPSPGNVQAIEFIVVEDEGMRQNLSRATGDPRVEDAPISIIVVADEERMKRRVGANYGEYCGTEVGCVVQNMRLVAREEDISSCWISGFEEDVVAQEFEIPEGKSPKAAVVLGYSDNEVPKSEKFGLNQVCFYDTYDNQVASFFDNIEWKGLREEKKIYGKKKKGLIDKVARKVRQIL